MCDGSVHEESDLETSRTSGTVLLLSLNFTGYCFMSDHVQLCYYIGTSRASCTALLLYWNFTCIRYSVC